MSRLIISQDDSLSVQAMYDGERASLNVLMFDLERMWLRLDPSSGDVCSKRWSYWFSVCVAGSMCGRALRYVLAEMGKGGNRDYSMKIPNRGALCVRCRMQSSYVS